MPTNAINDTGVKYLYDKLHGEIEQISDIVDDSTSHKSDNPISITGLKSTQNAINPIVTLEPIQDLHGQDKPYPAGGGKNLMNPEVFDDTSYYTVNTDGSIKVLATDGRAFSNISEHDIKAGTYVISCSGAGTSDIRFASENYTTGHVFYTSVSFTLNADDKFKIKIGYNNGSSYPITKQVQLELGSSSTSWSPYENICPISGYDKIEVLSCGKNLIDGNAFADEIVAKVSGATKDTSAKTVTYTAGNITLIEFNICKFKANTQYSFYFSATGATNLQILYTNGTVTNLGANTWTISESGKSIKCIRGIWQTGTTVLKYEESGVFEGEVNTFAPYHKTTDLSESLGQTVYGGTLDLRSGKLTVDRAIVDMGDLSWEYTTGSKPYFSNTDRISNLYHVDVATVNPLKCTCYESVSQNERGDNKIAERSNDSLGGKVIIGDSRYTDGTTFQTAMVGQKICYKLAAPFTIQLTPTELTLLKDYAYVSTNGTRIDLDYRNGEMATLEDVLDAQNKLQEEIDNPISYDGKNYRLGMDATGLYLYNITDDTKAYIQMVTT